MIVRGVGSAGSANHGHDVFFPHYQEIVAVDLHFRSAVLAEQDLVADLDVERADVAVLEK